MFKLDIGHSCTGDAAGVSPEIGITYIPTIYKSAIMDFDDKVRNWEIVLFATVKGIYRNKCVFGFFCKNVWRSNF